MPTSIDDVNRAANQRDFYLKLVPHGGQWLASHLGGFTPPAMDSQEEELRATISLWVTAQMTGAYKSIADTSWWMTQYMDNYRRMTREETQGRSDELTAFAIASIGQLIDQGIITWAKEVELPEFRTSTHGMNSTVDQAILDRLDATWGDEEIE